MEKDELLRRIKLYLFDMDGTLYLGDQLYPFTIDLLNKLKETGRKYLFMTNNSSKSVDDYIKKLAKLGIPSTREDFITSSQATAYYLKEHYPGRKLYVCGTRSLKKELEMEGFTVTESVEETEVIVMGFDTELTFRKLHDVSYMLLTLGILGTGGGNCPLQIDQWKSFYHLTLWQAWALTAAGGYIGCLFFSFLTMYVSARTHSTMCAPRSSVPCRIAAASAT